MASLMRCAEMLKEWGVESVHPDLHERPYCLPPDEVDGLCYLQKGYTTPTAGQHNFFFIDTMWEKLK